MEVECAFFGPFREDVGDKTVRIDTAASTVGDLLAEIEARYPDLEGRLLEDDEVRPEIAVTLNEKHVQHVDGVETTLADGDVLRLTPAVYGG